MGGKDKEIKSQGVKHEPPHTIGTCVSEPEVLYAVRENKITSSNLAVLKYQSDMTDERLAAALNLNIKTFRSYKANQVELKPHLQEHVFTLQSLVSHGILVFGTNGRFNDWLEKPNHFFDNDAPVNFLTTIGGIRYVDDRLTAIEYGDNV